MPTYTVDSKCWITMEVVATSKQEARKLVADSIPGLEGVQLMPDIVVIGSASVENPDEDDVIERDE